MNKEKPLNDVIAVILAKANDGLLPFQAQQSIAARYDLPLWDVERLALEANITPLRYARNRDTINCEQQLQLLNTRVALIGCGGLGGHAAEMLTRIGVGHLTLIDPDVFDEHNLNRQNFSTPDVLGQPKVHVLQRHLSTINPAVQIRPLVHHFDPLEDRNLIHDADVVIDALDNPEIKRALAHLSRSEPFHFVHGAIAGMSGQLAVNSTLEHLYPDDTQGAEIQAGNLAYSAVFIAAMQVSETIKLILGIGESLEGQVVRTDLAYNDFMFLPV